MLNKEPLGKVVLVRLEGNVVQVQVKIQVQRYGFEVSAVVVLVG